MKTWEKWSVFAVTVFTMALLAFATVGCLSPGDKEELAQYDAAVTIKEAEAAEAAAAGDQALVTKLQSEIQQIKQAAADREREILASQGEGIADLVVGAFPPLAPIKTFINPWILPLAGFFSKRWREHLKNSAKAIKNLNFGQAVGSIGKMVGMAHTESDPTKLTGNVASVIGSTGPVSMDTKADLVAAANELLKKANAVPVISVS